MPKIANAKKRSLPLLRSQASSGEIRELNNIRAKVVKFVLRFNFERDGLYC